MNWFFGVAVYFIIWWLTLFLVLPFGFRSQQDVGEKVPGTVASAPARHRVFRTFGVTTLVAAVIFVAWYVVSFHYGLTFDSLPQLVPFYKGSTG